MRIKDKARLAIAVGLASATVAATALAPATAFADYKGYHDVPANHWAVTGGVIDWAEYNGIINGFPDGSWGADMTVNRAQAAAILYNLAGQPKVTGSPQFDDAASLGWATTAATWAQQQGIFTGTVHADGSVTFDPWNSLTREQSAKILSLPRGVLAIMILRESITFRLPFPLVSFSITSVNIKFNRSGVYDIPNSSEVTNQLNAGV